MSPFVGRYANNFIQALEKQFGVSLRHKKVFIAAECSRVINELDSGHSKPSITAKVVPAKRKLVEPGTGGDPKKRMKTEDTAAAGLSSKAKPPASKVPPRNL